MVKVYKSKKVQRLEQDSKQDVLKIDMCKRLLVLEEFCKLVKCENVIGSVAWKLEASAFSHAVKFGTDYYILVQRQMAAISMNKNWIENNGETSVNILMSNPEKLCIGSDIYIARQQKKRNSDEAFATLKKLDTLDLQDESSAIKIRCRKCNNTDLKFQIQQRASADEPSSIKVQCSKCSNRWMLNR